MSTAAYVNQPTVIRIPNLLAEVRDGAIRVPRFQRPPVWNQSQRIALLESIRAGIPIGSMLVWRTRKYAGELDVYPLGPGAGAATEAGDALQYVLDGHQRLTTLFTILGWGLVPPESRPTAEERRKDPIYGDVGQFYYDLENQQFEIRGRHSPPPHWLPLDDLFDDYALYEYTGETLGKLPNGRALINRARSLHKTFYDYQVAMVPISTDDLESAIVSFERANRAGTRMSEAHMVSALVYMSKLDLNAELDQIRGGLDGWEELESKYVLAISKARLDLDLFSSQTSQLVEAIKQDHALIEQTSEALATAVEFLAEQCHVFGPETLPYSYQLVLIADVLRERSRLEDYDVRERLERWFWVTSYVEYFASISSTRLRATLESLRDYVDIPLDQGYMLPARYSRTEVLPPRRFDFRGARSRALALMMAKELAKYTVDVHRTLAQFGHRAMPKLLTLRDMLAEQSDPEFDVFYEIDPTEGFENRFIADPREARELRRKLLAADPADADLLLRHGIDARAAEHLRNKDYDEFLRARRAFFIAKEKQFVESLGLTYIEEDEP